MARTTFQVDDLLTPGEVAAMFRVDALTVTRWAKAGRLSAIRTLGGHRRYRAAEVDALLAGSTTRATSGSVAEGEAGGAAR